MEKSSNRKLGKKLSLYLDEETVRKLKYRAADEGCACNSLIVEAIDRYLQTTKAAQSEEPIAPAVETVQVLEQKQTGERQTGPETSELLKAIQQLIRVMVGRDSVPSSADPSQAPIKRFLPPMTWEEQQALAGWIQPTSIDRAIGILFSVLEKREEPLTKEQALSILVDQRSKRVPNRTPSVHIDAVVQEGIDRGVWVQLENGSIWPTHLFPLDNGKRYEGLISRFGG